MPPGPDPTGPLPPRFDDAFRDQLEGLLRWRRDVRRFRRDALAPGILDHLLDLACLAPSVGYSQPWRFVLVEDVRRRTAIRANFVDANQDALAAYHGERAQLYARLKLSGLDDAPVQLAVCTDPTTMTGKGLGCRTMPQTLDQSTAMAVMTLWLAARAQGVGVGWVSILDPVAAIAALDVPPAWHLTAYLCIGYPEQEASTPELARLGWETRDPAGRDLVQR
ncbi:MAG: 5,6-dimethylbenzimidazole synthase [Azospirillaceae bacterium]|nr:5,6-dimethylbenzimidazole synthase [Azospirillaceae bacterium]